MMNSIVRDEVELSIQQFSQAWRLMCAGAPGRRFEDGDGVLQMTLTRSGTRLEPVQPDER